MLVRIKEKIIKNIKKDKYLYYFGQYQSWEEASKESAKYGESYQDSAILDRVAKATERVRCGDGLYEQDGVVYYENLINYELVSAFLYVYTKQKKLNVIDFGGALGSTYFRYKKILEACNPKWEVVEQPHYVEYGNNSISEIVFHNNIFQCNLNADVVLLSSVLGYLDDPYKIFRNIMECEIPYIIIDETAFSPEKNKSLITLQHVPESIYKAIYPVHLFAYNKFVELINEYGYEITWEWDYRYGNIPIKEGFNFVDSLEKGFLLTKK